MYRSPFKILSPRRLFGLTVVAAMVMVAGCTDGEETQSTMTEFEAQASHLGTFSADLTDPGDSPETINGAEWQFPVPFNVGTGRINPFLRVQKNPEEYGFNTDGATNYDQKSGSFTHSVLLSDVPTVLNGTGDPVREIIFDANESNSDEIAAQFAINEFNLYECVDNAAAATYSDSLSVQDPNNCTVIYDGADADSRIKATDAATQGSGNALDYRILIPDDVFTDVEACPYAPSGGTACNTYIILEVNLGDSHDSDWQTDATFEEFSTIRRPQVTVSKTAQVDFTRTYDWTVTKEADPDSHQLLQGEKGTTTYTITADTTGFTDSGFQVSGTITIENNSGETAQIDGVEDVLPDGSTSLLLSNDELTCAEGTTSITSGDLPYNLDDGGVITCEYSAPTTELDEEDVNTAIVSISDPEDLDTNLPDVEATADPVEGTITEVDATVDVYDQYLGSDDADGAPVLLGQASVDDPPPTSFTRTRDWTYSETVCGLGTVDNTGSIYSEGADPSTATALATDDAQVTITCADLSVTKTAETSLTRTINWTIDKSVTPDTWDLFTGDEGTSEYTVSVDSVDFTDSEWAVSGTITVENTGAFAVDLSGVTDVVDGSINASVSCGGVFDGGATHSLATGATLTCSYEADLPDGDPGTNVATAHIDGNGSFSSDPVDFDFTDPTITAVNDEINVEDTNGQSWTATGDMSWTYEETFSCDTDEGQHDNTATIVETDQTASASVTVDCHNLAVTKDANTSLTRTWDWSIQKDIDESVFLEDTYDSGTNTATIGEGVSLLVEWDVILDATSTDSEWAVDGTITITNNHPSMDAMLTDVSDVVSPDIAASVDCSGASTVPADGSIDCTYDADLPDATTRDNTATATLQNKAFDKDGFVENIGTTEFSSSAVSVDFSTADVTMIDECVDVSDVLKKEGVEVGSQDLGTLCANETTLPHTFDVQFTFGGTDGIAVECGENVFDNTGSFTTNDTETTGSATSSITIQVECIVGCTLTQGYWKTHNDSFRGGAPTDETWQLLGDVDGDGVEEAEGEEFFDSGQSWFEVFWTAPKGNVYYNLAHQYMAAYLNTLAGASAPQEVQDALADAEDWFETTTPDDANSLRGNNPERKQVLEWASIFADYNEGLIGPGHCTENDEEVFTD